MAAVKTREVPDQLYSDRDCLRFGLRNDADRLMIELLAS